MRRKPLVLVVACAALSLTACLPRPTLYPTQASASTARNDGAVEQTNFDALNALRSSVGVGALTRTDEANAKARSQANLIAGNGKLSHTTNWTTGVAPGWTAMAENVAVAGTVEAAMNGLINSPDHYRNMTDPRFTDVGVGVTVTGDGRVWLVQYFIGR
jgi:uncharacterized protein YkwD